jgi:ArsR family transcriptional regulator, cadmium/lead-responsive transcriptional repressor
MSVRRPDLFSSTGSTGPVATSPSPFRPEVPGELGERRVSDLIASSGLTQSNVSKHLACLWECGLVERERRGREIHYRLVAGIAELLASADAVLATTGERVRACPRYGVLRRQAA